MNIITQALELANTAAVFEDEYGELNGRLDRGYLIAARPGQVIQVQDDRWLIKSQRQKRMYTVTWQYTDHDKAGWSCSCPDIQNGAPKFDFCGSVNNPICKHIIAVTLLWSAGIDCKPRPKNGNGSAPAPITGPTVAEQKVAAREAIGLALKPGAGGSIGSNPFQYGRGLV